jgi:hypothetical protein
MQEITYLDGPRILEDGTNLDADIRAVHPIVTKREIYNSVSDGSLGEPTYATSQLNKDGGTI